MLNMKSYSLSQSKLFSCAILWISFFILLTITVGDAHALTSSNKEKIKIGFYVPHFNIRGTEVAVYDYADCNETILGNESFIIYVDETGIPEGSLDYPRSVREKFFNRFQDNFYVCANFNEVESLISKLKIDALYQLTSGEPNGRVSRSCKNLIHGVFQLGLYGDMFAAISQWLSDTNPSLHIPVVPHMVRVDSTHETLHDELGIPRGAVVFGRHGGYGTFSVGFASEAVVEVAMAHPDWYFLFLNTAQFCNLPNVIFLPGTAEMVYKTKFINTCDAMIHARIDGETFGLACAEFSIKNKPVITWVGGAGAHISILGSKGIYYHNKEELISILLSSGNNIEEIRQSNWDAYSEKYNPQTVMETFDKVFLQPYFH